MALTEITQPRSAEQILAWSRASADPELRTAVGELPAALRHISNPLTASLAGGAGLPRLDTSRLRATWLAQTAALIGLPAFLHAAGIGCSQRLGDIIATLDPGGEAEAVALLGASAR